MSPQRRSANALMSREPEYTSAVGAEYETHAITAVCVRIHLSEGTESEAPVHIRTGKRDIAHLRTQSQRWVWVNPTTSKSRVS